MLVELLATWHRLEPRNCFPLRASKRKLYVVKLDEKSHSTIDPVDPKAEDFAKLQRALQYAIADHIWTSELKYFSASKAYETTVWNDFGIGSDGEGSEAAVALLIPYLHLLEGQSEIEVEAEVLLSPSLLAQVESKP